MNFQGYGAPAAHGYGSGFPGQQQQDPLYGCFTAVAGHDGQISAEELQACLTQANFSGGYRPFNLETCRLMISMLDRDMSCSMGFNEFKELWAVLSGWKQHFMSIDRDMSGTVDSQEMNLAVSSMGYRLSPQTMNCIIKRFSSNGKISFDDYVACCVKLRSLTDLFSKRNQAQQGMAAFQYDDEMRLEDTEMNGLQCNVWNYRVTSSFHSSYGGLFYPVYHEHIKEGSMMPVFPNLKD